MNNPGLITLFVANLYSQGLSPATITSRLSALAYYFKLKGIDDSTQHFLVQKAISGARKLSPSMDLRLPITIPILHQLMAHARDVTSSGYYRKLLKSMLSLGFHGFLRPGEMTSSPNNIQFCNVSFQSDAIEIVFYKYKHSTSRPVTIKVSSQIDDTCPVRAMQGYLASRGNQPGALYCSPSCHPISYAILSSWFKQLLCRCGIQGCYNLHSLRVGAATKAALNNVPPSVIQSMGRWRSGAFLKYIRIPQLKI